MSRCLGFAGIMSTKPIVEIFARADISASGRFASQNVNVKHQRKIGLVGFEPTACRRGDRSSAIAQSIEFVVTENRAGGI
jgi:hypothetical protein